MEVAFALPGVLRHVETSRHARSREGEVAPLLQACLARAEHERTLDRYALSRVPGQRIGVAQMTGIEVATGERDAVAAVGRDGELTPLRVDGLDRAARPVLDAEHLGVAQA